MKITKLSLWHVGLTSHETYYMADNKTCDTVESVVIKIDTDTGITGWGEAFCQGLEPPEISAEVIENSLKELIINENPIDIEKIWLKMKYTIHVKTS